MKTLSAAYLLSGFLALAFEVIWFRFLELALGTSAAAVTSLLSGYMLGMTAGALLAGRFLARRPGFPPQRMLCLLHLVAAASGLVLLGLDPDTLPRFSSFPPAGWFLGLVLVFPPAAAAGAALPALAVLIGPGRGRASTLAALYGLNIVGGALGMASLSFAGLELFGMHRSLLAAMAMAVALAFFFLGMKRLPQSFPAEEEALDVKLSAGGGERVSAGWIAAAFALGFLGLGTETALIRLLTPLMGLSVYALAGTVLPFLAGLGLGGILAGRAVGSPSVGTFSFCAAGAGLALGSVPLALPYLPGFMVWLAGKIPPPGLGWGDLMAARILIAFLLLTAGAILVGMLFPLLLALAGGRHGPGPRLTGHLSGLNTLGAVLGPVLVGMLLIGAIGSGRTFRLLALGYPFLGVVVSLAGRRATHRKAPYLLSGTAALLLLLAPYPDPVDIHAGAYWAAHRYADRVTRPWQRLGQLSDREKNVLDVIEGPTASVVVVESGRQRYLAIDGKPASNTFLDGPTQMMLAHLPFRLRREGFGRILVIGWGSGQTAAEILRYPVEEVVCVEVSPEVAAAAPWFRQVNAAAAGDPRFRLVIDDARHYLRTSEGGFDLIISQPSNPWVGSSGQLFTREFFALARRRLGEGGEMVQWFQTYGATADDLRLFLATFSTAFRDWSLWVPTPGDLILTTAGSKGSIGRLGTVQRSAFRAYASDFVLEEGKWNDDDRPLLSFRMARHLMREPAGVLEEILGQ